MAGFGKRTRLERTKNQQMYEIHEKNFTVPFQSQKKKNSDQKYWQSERKKQRKGKEKKQHWQSVC